MGRIDKHDGRAWSASRGVPGNPTHFRKSETRAKMLAVAADYERMAETADRRELAEGPEAAGPRGTSPGTAGTPP